MILAYFIFNLVWITCFYNFLEKNKPKKDSNEDNKFWEKDFLKRWVWKDEYKFLFALSFFGSWIVILIIIIYKLSNTFLPKNLFDK